MPHKGKIPAEEKVRIVEGYLKAKIRYTQAQEIAGIDDKTLRNWISRYRLQMEIDFIKKLKEVEGRNR